MRDVSISNDSSIPPVPQERNLINMSCMSSDSRTDSAL